MDIDRKYIVTAPYISPLFCQKDRRKIIKHCVKTLRPIADTFDVIAIQGYSMALIAPMIADRLGKQIVLVRKKGESSHSSRVIEGLYGKSFNYIIIDDLVASGNTISNLTYSISVYGTCVGIYLYNMGSYDTRSSINSIPIVGRFPRDENQLHWQ